MDGGRQVTLFLPRVVAGLLFLHVDGSADLASIDASGTLGDVASSPEVVWDEVSALPLSQQSFTRRAILSGERRR